MKYRQTGFTLIEMIVVLVLIAIVSAVAAVRFFRDTGGCSKSEGS